MLCKAKSATKEFNIKVLICRYLSLKHLNTSYFINNTKIYIIRYCFTLLIELTTIFTTSPVLYIIYENFMLDVMFGILGATKFKIIKIFPKEVLRW